MMRVRDMTDFLDDTLERMATYFEKQHILQNTIQSSLSYPIVLLVLIIGVVLFLMLSIIPQFSSIYDQFGADLPAITQFVLNLSSIVQHFWWLFLFLIFIAIADRKSVV